MSPEELNARLTPEERRENARKAGKASVEARRERKAIQEVCREIDDSPLDSKSIKEVAQQLGMPEEWVAQMTHRTAKAFSVNKQILLKGDVKAWVEWLKVCGDYTETVNVNNGEAPLADGVVKFTSRDKQ